MSVTTTCRGAIGLAIQQQKTQALEDWDLGAAGDSAKDFLTVAGIGEDNFDWQWIRATNIDMAVQQRDETLPPEVGAGAFLQGAYKGGMFVGGGFDFIPRMGLTRDVNGDVINDDLALAHLMLGFAGQYGEMDTDGIVTSRYTIENIEGNAYKITFHMYVDDDDLRRECYAPWVALRKFIPGQNGDPSKDLGETYGDCRLAGLRFNLPAQGHVSARCDTIGRWVYKQRGTHDDGEIDWAPSLYNYDRPGIFPVSCIGEFQMPDITDSAGTGNAWTEGMPLETVAAKATDATVEMVTRYTTPDQESIIGSYYPDDFNILQRMINVNFTYRYSDPSLYEAIFYGYDANNSSVDPHQWSPLVFTGKFKWKAESPVYIPGTTTRYGIELNANNVRYAASPIVLRAADIIGLQFTGSVIAPDDPAVSPFSLSIYTDHDGMTLPQPNPDTED